MEKQGMLSSMSPKMGARVRDNPPKKKFKLNENRRESPTEAEPLRSNRRYKTTYVIFVLVKSTTTMRSNKLPGDSAEPKLEQTYKLRYEDCWTTVYSY